MKLIIITPPKNEKGEISTIKSLFEHGLECLHVRKPELSKDEIEDYINEIPAIYHSKVVLHSDYPKFHSLEELKGYTGKAEYAFLAPVFDSISKTGHKSPFTDRLYNFLRFDPELHKAIKNKKIIALGGVDEDKIDLLRKTGFYGVAILGALWQAKDPLAKFLRLKAKCEKTDLVY